VTQGRRGGGGTKRGKTSHADIEIIRDPLWDNIRLDRPALLALDTPTVQRLRAAYGTIPDPTDNDGVVPTLSQTHGELIHAVRGDHLDTIGHFGDTSANPPHVDWLVTGTGFDRARFDALWTAVVDYVAIGGR